MYKKHKFEESGLIRGYKFKGTSLWNQAEYDSYGCGHENDMIIKIYFLVFLVQTSEISCEFFI
jgi:hypothetical protein